MNKHTGSNFNDWLDDEGINQEVTAIAVKRVNGFITSTEFLNSLPADEQQAITSKANKLKQVYKSLEQIQATPINKAELERLANMPDSEIDYSDIPQLTDKQIANFKQGKEVFKFLDNEHYRPTKEQVTVRLDSDILAWLKQDGKGYQTRLNNLLRQMMITSHA